jgi:hypothetical protein
MLCCAQAREEVLAAERATSHGSGDQWRLLCAQRLMVEGAPALWLAVAVELATGGSRATLEAFVMIAKRLVQRDRFASGREVLMAQHSIA